MTQARSQGKVNWDELMCMRYRMLLGDRNRISDSLAAAIQAAAAVR
jgi:hypothetical protein